MTVETATTPYDVIAYPSRAQRECDPAHLATIAALRGFEAADVDRCHVLELGCGSGKGLISYGLAHPESRFVGVDLAATPIDAGKRVIAELGLKNVELIHADLAKFESREPFDFVIAHGVYSWLPPDTRDALLRVARSALAPKGIAYVGYATYPGCHLRELVRDLLLFHTDRMPDPKTKVQEGREFLQFLARVQTAGRAYGAVLERELKRISENDPNYVFHDDLAENNTPVYFAQFMQHAAEHGLAFLAESMFGFFEDPTLSSETKGILAQLSGGDLITLEQYLDFIRCRSFRQTLLCTSDLALEGAFDIGKARGLHASSTLKPESESPDLRSRAIEVFKNPGGSELSTDRPIVKAALSLLARAWPGFLPVDELIASARALLDDQDSTTDRATVMRALVNGASGRLIELSIRPPRFTSAPSDRPCASPLARLEAREGRSITSLRHYSLVLEDPASRHLIELMDGRRSQAELLDAMRAYFAAANAPPLETGEPRPSREEFEFVLREMARQAFLIS